MWLNDLKIALIEKNTDKLYLLINSIPKLETKNEMKEAVYLIEEVLIMLHGLKEKTSISMKKIKKNLHYLKSTQNHSSNHLDIKL